MESALSTLRRRSKGSPTCATPPNLLIWLTQFGWQLTYSAAFVPEGCPAGDTSTLAITAGVSSIVPFPRMRRLTIKITERCRPRRCLYFRRCEQCYSGRWIHGKCQFERGLGSGSTFFQPVGSLLQVSSLNLQGGGHSLLSPVYGLGVDRVVCPPF